MYFDRRRLERAARSQGSGTVTMARTRLALLVLIVAAGMHGCSVQDADQPPVGSISVKAREEGAESPIAKKAVKRFGARR